MGHPLLGIFHMDLYFTTHATPKMKQKLPAIEVEVARQR
jgi:hypothetical protein